MYNTKAVSYLCTYYCYLRDQQAALCNSYCNAAAAAAAAAAATTTTTTVYSCQVSGHDAPHEELPHQRPRHPHILGNKGKKVQSSKAIKKAIDVTFTINYSSLLSLLLPRCQPRQSSTLLHSPSIHLLVFISYLHSILINHLCSRIHQPSQNNSAIHAQYCIPRMLIENYCLDLQTITVVLCAK